MTSQELAARLTSIGQSSVLRFWQELDEAGQRRLIEQITALDLDQIPGLVAKYVTGKYTPPIPSRFDPATPLPHDPQTPEQRKLYEDARKRGRELVRNGQVAALMVAGGQGTRLGHDGPKGEYPVTPIRKKPLFQVFAEQLLGHSRHYGRTIPWYIMTSEANDAATRAFFKKHDYFGYDPSAIFFFQQGMMPAFSFDGKMLLAEKDSLALSPGGNGDCYRSMVRSGALEDMKKRGIKHLSFFFVDNPLVHCIDEQFLGLHDLTGSDISSKAIPKASPEERVGVFAMADGKLQVVEYSDMPRELAAQTNPDGSLRYSSASIGIHAFRVDLVERIGSGEFKLPWHRAEKKVPCIDEQGSRVKPQQPNAVKLEMFMFDVLPLSHNPLVYMTQRGEEFSPVKNAEGNDSPATSRRDQIRRAARWLEACGVEIPRTGEGEVDAVIEISSKFAANLEQLMARKHELPRIQRGATVYIE